MFKSGDVVRRINSSTSDLSVGDIVTVDKLTANGESIYFREKGDTCWDTRNFQLVNNQQIRYVMMYRLSGCNDPTELFSDLQSVKKRIDELLTSNTLVLDSVQIYEVKKQHKVNLSIKLSEVTK